MHKPTTQLIMHNIYSSIQVAVVIVKTSLIEGSYRTNKYNIASLMYSVYVGN